MAVNEKVFGNGTEVLIFKYMEGWRNQDTEHFIRGTIVHSEKSGDISYCGNPLYVMNYTVLGEDGNKYFGNMGHHIFGESFFMTREMYINHLVSILVDNESKIEKINEENKKISDMIKKIYEMERISIAPKQRTHKK